ncbi:MAG: transcriptional regulator, tetR family [Moraxellaceae bacterium]|jgi:AcrR family transcriptional regulator|nr:transcriptional regulator, tetR family [Moraxellaceae bacterium]
MSLDPPLARRGRPVSEAGAAERRRKLCDAAIAVAVRTGVAGLTTRAVAEEAGLSPAMLHYEFTTKDGLLLALLEYIHTDVYQALAQSVPGQCGLATALSRMAQRYWMHAQATPGLQRVQYELALHALTLEGGEALAHALYEGYVDEIVAVFQRAALRPVPPAVLRDAAGTALAFMDGLILQGLATGNAAAGERRLQTGIRALQPVFAALDDSPTRS